MQVLNGSQVSARVGDASTFSGRVWVEALSDTHVLDVSVFRVTFEPGARTAWHTHPHGQTLVFTGGHGLVQKRGEAVLAVQQGDVVVIAPGEEHWHGAAQGSLTQHLAIQRAGSSGPTKWLDLVSDVEGEE